MKLKLLELDERDVLLIKRQYVNTINSNINATTVTSVTTMPKGMKVKFPRNFEGEGELNHNMPFVFMLSKGCNSNILGTVWCVKLKLTGPVVRDVEQIKSKCLHPNATASTQTTTTVTIITTAATKA